VRLIDLDDNEKLVGVARAEREEERENGADDDELLEEAGLEQENLPETGPAEEEE
jgi:hypothetical protein